MSPNTHSSICLAFLSPQTQHALWVTSTHTPKIFLEIAQVVSLSVQLGTVAGLDVRKGGVIQWGNTLWYERDMSSKPSYIRS